MALGELEPEREQAWGGRCRPEGAVFMPQPCPPPSPRITEDGYRSGGTPCCAYGPLQCLMN